MNLNTPRPLSAPVRAVANNRLLRWLTASAVVAFLIPSGLAQSAEYIVGARDVLVVSVWNQPTLSGKFTIEADGTFAFPLLGRIRAGGLSPREVEVELMKRLADGYLKNPQVNVSVENYRSQQVFVVGEVRQPGTYPFTGEMTLIEALARAGSTTVRAADEVVIVRPSPDRRGARALLPGEDEKAELLRVDFKELHTGAASRNIALRDGDTLFVLPAETAYVSGHVRNPGAYAIHKETTILEVLTLAGGATDRGSTARIRIIRTVNDRKTEIKAKSNDLVRPGDTIVVPERLF